MDLFSALPLHEYRFDPLNIQIQKITSLSVETHSQEYEIRQQKNFKPGAKFFTDVSAVLGIQKRNISLKAYHRTICILSWM